MAPVLNTAWAGMAEAARTVGVSPETLRRMADRGEVACLRTKLGRLVNLKDAERLAAQRAAAKQTEAGNG